MLLSLSLSLHLSRPLINNSYEGTGRSLSLKLIEQLRQQQQQRPPGSSQGTGTSRVLREITLEDPIRYSAGDPIERWLNELLCLDASIVPKVPTGCPAPDKCELYVDNARLLTTTN